MEWMLALFEERKPKRILEIGTYFGGTLKQWLYRCPRRATVVSVDLYTLAYADNRDKYAKWASGKQATVHVIAGDSQAEATIEAARKHGPYDWILIDGNHYYGPASNDWRNYGAMAAPGGVVVFHDILDNREAHPEIETARLWAEIKAEHKTDEFIQGNGKWGGIGVVFIGEKKPADDEEEGDGITAEQHAADGLVYNWEH
jgi:predicted O-methyltransferase YrrM